METQMKIIQVAFNKGTAHIDMTEVGEDLNYHLGVFQATHKITPRYGKKRFFLYTGMRRIYGEHTFRRTIFLK